MKIKVYNNNHDLLFSGEDNMIKRWWDDGELYVKFNEETHRVNMLSSSSVDSFSVTELFVGDLQ